MENKKFKHNEVEVCNLCSKDIATTIDEWCSLIDFKGKNQKNIKFYHNVCLRDLIQGQSKVIEHNFKEKVNTMIHNLLGKDMPTQFQIK